ncbi:MAG: beta-glucuronidase [Butyrivibrio sp.]|jgi:beta-glucuronidase|nr:beta-glucuronidase [Butyrivibrio sp.]
MLYPVENEIRQVMDLSGIWEFRKEEKEEEGFHEKWYRKPLVHTIEMPVPASYNDVTTDRSLRDHVGWVWYEKEFYVPDRWKEERIVLRFGSVTHHAVVYLNGDELMRHKGGFLPFEHEITEALQPGKNRLTVAVSNLLDWTCLPCGEHRIVQDEFTGETRHEQEMHFDFFNYAGIHRPVKIYTTPMAYIHDICVTTETDGEDGLIHYSAEADAQIHVTLTDAQGSIVASAEGTSGILRVQKAHLWNPGKAYLYDLEIYAETDHYTLPVGIRTIRVTDRQFLINGKPFYFKGFGKHEDSDIRGKGLDQVLNVRDFELMKWIHANSFRTSHYPYSEELMQMADRQGLVVIDEVPAVGMCFFDTHKVFTAERVNEETCAYHMQTLTELYERDKNHACVVMWSVANEAHTSDEEALPYFSRICAHIRALDPTRPVTSTMCVDVAEDQISQLLDVVSVNRYYSWYSDCGRIEVVYPKMKKDLENWREKYHKPVLVTEYGADTIAGLHKLPEVMFSEEYQVEFLKENNRAIDSCDFVIGEHIWCFADFMTGYTVQRIDGNKKGIFTRERQPKSAAFVIRQRWMEK